MYKPNFRLETVRRERAEKKEGLATVVAVAEVVPRTRTDNRIYPSNCNCDPQCSCEDEGCGSTCGPTYDCSCP